MIFKNTIDYKKHIHSEYFFKNQLRISFFFNFVT